MGGFLANRINMRPVIAPIHLDNRTISGSLPVLVRVDETACFNSGYNIRLMQIG